MDIFYGVMKMEDSDENLEYITELLMKVMRAEAKADLFQRCYIQYELYIVSLIKLNLHVLNCRQVLTLLTDCTIHTSRDQCMVTEEDDES